MSQFKKGQTISVKKNGFLGHVHEIDSLNYHIEWENRPGEVFLYLITEVEQGKDWLLSKKSFITKALPRGAMGPQKQSQESCIHDYQLYVGFRESYRFCSKCDKKLYT